MPLCKERLDCQMFNINSAGCHNPKGYFCFVAYPQATIPCLSEVPCGALGSETQRVLGILKNPYGHSAAEIKEVQLKACDLIERWKDAYLNMREFAENNGLATVTHG